MIFSRARITLSSGIKISYLESAARKHGARKNVAREDVAGAGAGDAALVLVHGFTGNADDFAGVRCELAKHARVVLPELRGHGASTHCGAASAYSFETLTADLVEFLERQPAPAHLLGHSMAGMLALRIALARPELLTSLLLMSTSPLPLTGVTEAKLKLAGTIAREHGMRALCEAVRAQAQEAGAPPRGRSEEEIWAWQRARYASMDPHAYEALARAMLEQESQRARLPEIALPTTVIIGEADEQFLAPSKLLAKEIPGAKLELLPAAAHQPQFEARKAFLAAVKKHLIRVRKPATN